MVPKVLVLLPLLLSGRATASENVIAGLNMFDSTVGTWFQCSFQAEPSRCLEENTLRQMRSVVTDLDDEAEDPSRTGKNLAEEEEEEDAEVRSLKAENERMLKTIEENKSEPPGFLDEFTDFFANGLYKIFEDMFGLKDDSPKGSKPKATLEGRGHKKKYLKKQNKHLKLILILMLIKNKIKMFLHKFQFLVQLKFLAIAVANLLINAVRLWLELKKKHKPNKVIYYEKSHHQHHYDNEHIHDEPYEHSYPGSYTHHGHHVDEHDEGGIWPWSRSYSTRQGDYLQVQPYRLPGPSAQHLAYMNQRPIR